MNSFGRLFTSIVTVSMLLCWASIGNSQDNPRHIDLDPSLMAVETVPQNWSDDESNWFYNIAQGSRLLPYRWFLHLEQPDSEKPFLDPEHIRDLGYIARKPSPDNPHGLPIGFVKDAKYDDGTRGLGLTCAACHTGQINFNKTAYVIDGAPTMGDMERLLKRLAASLRNTAADDDKFERFADKVLPAGASEDQKKALRSGLKSKAGKREGYNKRNLPAQESHRFGHGRVDAFGAIFNEVSATFLGISGNAKPASAPVSYPCLWDAPQHDRVQWNGAAENRTSKLGIPLFGTDKVGALGRNSGEVLGVFGHVDINADELLLPKRYASTVNKDNLLVIEESLKTLWSPQWPAAFGPIDAARKARGAAIYEDNCSECHKPITRDSPKRKVEAVISDEGTDPMMLRNFVREGETGRLEGRRKTLLGHEHFESVDRVALILKHVVERVMLNSLPKAELEASLAVDFSDVNALNPGYQNTAIVKMRDKEVRLPLDSLDSVKDKLRIKASNSNLLDFAHDVHSKLGDEVTKKKDRFRSLKAARKRVGHVLDLSGADDEETSSEIEIENATASFGYKARPLNGIWATAPYLHNGSVPTLADLLKPAAERKQKFHVGSMEYDPDNVGFVDDATFPEYDTSIVGNSNAGHEYGGDLTPKQRLDLLEYLKSL